MRHHPTGAVVLIALCLLALHATAIGQGAVTSDAWDVLERALQEDGDPADVEQLASRLGGDPVTLHGWVHAETELVPYRGALRGARGVLTDRAGNALDRALLLHALLVAAGHDAALARARLHDAELATLAGAIAEPRTVGVEPPAAAGLDALAARAERELGLDADAVRHTLTEAAARQWTLHDTAAQRVETIASALLPALPATALAAPEGHGVEALRDHWWVVLGRDGDGLLDLDPSLPVAGARLTAHDSVHPITLARDVASIDGDCPELRCGDLLHLVVVRALVEIHADGVREEHTLLEHALVTAEQGGLGIGLGVIAFGGDGVGDPFAITEPANALVASLLEHDRWRPMIAIGADEIVGQVVTDGGHVHDDPDDRPAAPSRGPLGGFGAIGGRAPATPEARGLVTALWWEFEVVTPGHPDTVERRAVVDLLGPERRAALEPPGDLDEAARLERALAMAGQSELLVTGAALSEPLLAQRAARRLLAERDAFESWSGPLDAPISETNERLLATTALVSPLERLSVERALAMRSAGSGPQAGASVVAYHQRLRADLALEAAFDVVAAPPGAASPDGPATARLRAGILDAVLEGLVAVEPDEAAARPAPSVAEAFVRDPSGWLAVAPGEAFPPDTSLAGDLAARARADLAAGFVVIVPTGAADAAGHWRLDPVTGATLAIGPLGWGQAMTSYAERVATVIQVQGVIKQYASMGRCLGMAISQPLQGISGVGPDLAECVFTVVCGGVESAVGKVFGGEPSWTSIAVGQGVGKAWGGMCSGLWAEISR